MKLDPSITQREAIFDAVMNTVSDAITVIDKDLKITFQQHHHSIQEDESNFPVQR